MGGWIPAQPQWGGPRGPCPGSTGVLKASCNACPGEGGLTSCIPHHGPTSCTPHPAPCTPQAAYIPSPCTAAALGALCPQVSRRHSPAARQRARRSVRPGSRHAQPPRFHTHTVTPLRAPPRHSTPPYPAPPSPLGQHRQPPPAHSTHPPPDDLPLRPSAAHMCAHLHTRTHVLTPASVRPLGDAHPVMPPK